MQIKFSPDAWEDYLYWQKNSKDTLKKINNLIKECQRTPFEGTGNPEPLRHGLSGFWSRRINSEDRLVYEVVDDTVTIIMCKNHYEK